MIDEEAGPYLKVQANLCFFNHSAMDSCLKHETAQAKPRPWRYAAYDHWDLITGRFSNQDKR